MITKRIIFLKTAALILLSVFYSCAINPVTGQQELMLVSETQEIGIGKESAPSLRWEFGGYYNDPALEAYLEAIVKRLWQISERPQLPLTFHVQNTSIPNAFALPGYVAITRGLLCAMENEAQFASVIGHEIGHVMARHTAQKLSRLTLQQLGLSVGAVALQGKAGSDALLQAGAVGSSLLLLKYDRGQEIQADRLGVKYMARLGYDPNEALASHTVLEKAVDDYLKRLGKSRSGDSFVSEMISSHPRAEIRLGEIQAMIREIPPYTLQGDGKFSSRFQGSTKKIREANASYFLYDKAENYYQQENFSAAEETIQQAVRTDPAQPPFHTLSGLIKLQQKNYAEAEKAFDKAREIDRDYQPALYGAGLVSYYREKYNQAVVDFKRSLDLFPSHVQSHFGLGKSYYKLQQFSAALPYLRNFAEAAPKHPEIHGLLGVCYEKTGDARSAIIEYGNQLKVAPDNEIGKYSRSRLSALAPQNR